MQIIIDIAEEHYNDICNSQTASNYSVLEALDSIRNGTPLPKGHGALIDVDALVGKIHGVRSISAVIDAPILIPAYKEENNAVSSYD